MEGVDVEPPTTIFPEARKHSMRTDEDICWPALRELFNEYHDIFIELQTVQKKDLPREKKKNHLVSVSKNYRSVIRACVEKLQKVAASTRDTELADGVGRQASALRAIELIWDLCEVLFVQAAPEGALMRHLLDWARLHKADVEEEKKEVRGAPWTRSPREPRGPWEVTVKSCVLQGRLEDARLTLAKQAARQPAAGDMFRLMDHLLGRMPVYDGTRMLAEFGVKWRRWHELVEHCLSNSSFSNGPHLEVVCKILAGDEGTLLAHKDLLGTWYHFMIARLLYSYPTVQPTELYRHARSCISVFLGSGGVPEPLDNILLAAFECDVHQVIKDCGVALNSRWFVAHLTDLLHHCNQLRSRDPHLGPELRESLLLEYAAGLLSHPSLWQLAVDYYDHCPVSGRARLARQMESARLDTEDEALEVLRLCKQRRMYEQARSVSKVMAQRALRSSRLGPALSWAVRAKDAALATLVSERLLQDYRARGTFSDADLIDNLGTDMLLSDRLTFLGKYREFHKLHEEKRFGEAAELLVSLVAAKIAPRSFWWTLLADAVPLVEQKEVIFSAEQTYELMAFLEELTSPFQTDAPSPDAPTQEGDATKVELFRLALARNLSMAIVKEGTKTGKA